LYYLLERDYHPRNMKIVQGSKQKVVAISGPANASRESRRDPSISGISGADTENNDSPALRLFALLEVIASKDQRYSLQDLVVETGLPKPTLHRMLQQLESAGLLQREGGGRHYGTGTRLRRLAEDLLLNDTHHGARHVVLRHLVEEVGESCNITALSGSEVVYLDRVETAAPLRFYLHPGSRVPAHCSASGKVLLAQMSPAQRNRLLAHAPLEKYTPNTVVDLAKIEKEIKRVQGNGYALDDEEFLPGLLCIAVLVPSPDGPSHQSNLCVAVQAPIMRLTAAKARRLLPALKRAALALSRIDGSAAPLQSKHARA
jgi:IclR family acetate operon transcriptional repressor